MKADKSSGIRSAYELAMERLEKREGKAAALTASQKKAIAEIEAQTRAGLAEVEFMMEANLAAARAAGDAEKIRLIDESKAREIGKIKAKGEEDKERVRRGATTERGATE